MPYWAARLATLTPLSCERNKSGRRLENTANATTRPPSAASSGRWRGRRSKSMTGKERPREALGSAGLALCAKLPDSHRRQVRDGIGVRLVDDLRPGQEVVRLDQTVADVVRQLEHSDVSAPPSLLIHREV